MKRSPFQISVPNALLIHGIASFVLLSPIAAERDRFDIAGVLAVDVALATLLFLFVGSPPISNRSWKIVALFGVFLGTSVLSQLAWGDASLLESGSEVARVWITMAFVLSGAHYALKTQQTSRPEDRLAIAIVAVAFLANARGIPSALDALLSGGRRAATQFWWYALYAAGGAFGVWRASRRPRGRMKVAIGALVPAVVMAGGAFRSGIAILGAMSVLLLLRSRLQNSSTKRGLLGRLLPLVAGGGAAYFVLRTGNIVDRFAVGQSASEGRRGLEFQEAYSLLNESGWGVLFLGEGIGSTLVESTDEFRSTTIHNSIIGSLIQSGLLGLSAFVIAMSAIAFVASRTLFSKTPTSDTLAASFVCLCGLLLSPLFSVLWGEPLWSAAAGFCLGSFGRHRRSKRAQRSRGELVSSLPAS